MRTNYRDIHYNNQQYAPSSPLYSHTIPHNNNRNASGYKQYQPSTYHQKYGQDRLLVSTQPQSPASRLAELNERLQEETQTIKRRSRHQFNLDTKSTSSEIRRSQINSERIIRSPSHSIYSSYTLGKNRYYPYEKTYSISSSRLRDQIFNQPIITHSSTMRQPILTTNNRYLTSTQYPSFKKYKAVQPRQEFHHIIPSNNKEKNILEDHDQFFDLNKSQNQSFSLVPLNHPNSKAQKMDQNILSPLGNKRSFVQKISDMLLKVDKEGKIISLFLIIIGIILVIVQTLK